MSGTRYYKISELSRLASVPVPTIRFYLKEGLLAPAVKTGKTMAYYTDEHLARLTLIKKMRHDEGKTIAQIRDVLGNTPEATEAPADTVITSSEKRDDIIAAAINLFIKKGLGETSIDDIAADARIGKGTFYRYFKDKNELFIECADSIFFEMYRNVWEEIKSETDMMKRLEKRALAFFESYPRWIDMMNLVRYASVGSDSVLKDKFHSVLDQIIMPIARDLEVLKQEGRMREGIDCLETAYILMGMAEYAAALAHGGKYGLDKISGIFLKLTTYGMKTD